MQAFSSLPGEVRNKVFALVVPHGVSIQPCRSSSLLGSAQGLHSLGLAICDKDGAQCLPHMLFRVLVVNDDNEYVYDTTEAQNYTALLQVDRATRQETAVQFYESNNFIFPGCYLLPMFLGRLSPTTLSYVQNISISAYLDTYAWDPTSIVPGGLKRSSMELLWSGLGSIGHCSNLRLLNISLEATSCDIQGYLLDQFERQGRETIGLLPKINVAFVACEACNDAKKSQHWRWGSESGSQEWKVIHFIGVTQVRTCFTIPQVSRTLYLFPCRPRNFINRLNNTRLASSFIHSRIQAILC
jgi:hypothetical protein